MSSSESMGTVRAGTDLGFIGIGAMGRAMAGSLIRAGFTVHAEDLDPSAVASVQRQAGIYGCRLIPAASCSLVISMLPSERATLEVARRLSTSMAASSVHIMMATIGPTLSKQIQTLHDAVGQRFVAAPVFGRPDEAAEGDLTIVAGGKLDQSSVRVLQALGRRVHFVEHPHQACTIKLAGNGLIGAAIAALAESFALVEANGISREQFHQIITGKLFQGPVYRGVGALMVHHEVNPPHKFSAALACKDIALLREAHKSSATLSPVADQVISLLEAAVKAGHADSDWSVMAQLAPANEQG